MQLTKCSGLKPLLHGAGKPCSASKPCTSIQSQPQASFLKSPSTSGNRNFESVAELNETEEDKLTHPIKKLKSTTLLDDQISIRNSVSHLSLQKRFSTLSFFESRYILFCDIRI
jgi:hypothetical protein